MSLIQTIKARAFQDLLQEGSVYSATGAAASAADAIIVPTSPARAAIVTGFTLTSDSATPILVSLGFKSGAGPTLVFWEGYVSSTGPVVKTYDPYAWYRGDLNYAVVITFTGQVAYAVDAKITSYPAALGYIEREGAPNPNGHGLAYLPPSPRAGESEIGATV